MHCGHPGSSIDPPGIEGCSALHSHYWLPLLAAMAAAQADFVTPVDKPLLCALRSLPRCAGVPRNVSFVGGVGQVTIKWESPERNPDPAATSYWLYATPEVGSRRRLMGEGKTAFAELKPIGGTGALAPAGGTGSFSTPYTAVVAIPGAVQSSRALSQLDCCVFPNRHNVKRAPVLVLQLCQCRGWPCRSCHALRASAATPCHALSKIHRLPYLCLLSAMLCSTCR